MEMPIFYRNGQIGTRRVDFFVENCVMLELKAIEKIVDVNKAQAINYLEAYHIADGLLINFGGLSLDFKRLYNKKMLSLPIETSQNTIKGLKDKGIFQQLCLSSMMIGKIMSILPIETSQNTIKGLKD